MRDERFGRADLLMIITCFLWAVGTIVCKNAFGVAPGSFRVSVFNGIRFSIATVLLFISVKCSGSPMGIRREHACGIAVVSFFGMFLFMMLFHVGLSMTTAGETGIIMGLIPLAIVLVSFVSGCEKLNRRLIAGLAIGFAGVVIMHWQEGRLTLNPGNILVLASCINWGIYAVFGEKYLQRYPPLVVTAWVFLFTSLYHLPLVIYRIPDQCWQAVTAANWFNLGFAAVVPLFFANSLYYAAIKRMGSSRSGAYIYLEPVFTVLLAFMLRHEHLSLVQIAGLTVILLGVGLSKTNGYER